MTNQDIQFTCADDVINDLIESGVDIDIPVDIIKIAKHYNIEIRYDLESTDIIGEIFFDEDKSPIIRVNQKKNSYNPRKRFTIAHELGHYFLHSFKSKMTFKDSLRNMSRKESYWDKQEREANNFAAELLMPTEPIFSECRKLIAGDDIPVDVFIQKIGDTFEVSNKAMEYRLLNLKILKRKS
uniref:Zn-dependent peptidase ImmA, M78 family n=1 Tax=Candidatus Kentrum sp. MB TaxID=2138164 RepID=A0A451B7X0_9GAMM|nr:MAG: Zn-dependent peptidase ImmA, M78 family [Candidatus Kentron sp. MB]VFK27657.1 MAG: Zn-dependent peptidase ImmA, M78 family [Candidatus Kentron sp. MB]VFK74379.1 MAG: Zn-dependent peptidase ImmA, M78 family [Candidatus Kentron sp. MB]